MRVGFLGTGRMGGPMALRLLRAGHVVRAWDPKGRTADLVDKGLVVVATAEEALARAEAVVTMMDPEVGAPLLARLAPHIPTGVVLVDTATTGPQAARRQRDLLARHGVRMVDAPVVGRPSDARRGRLAVFAGGDPDDVDVAMELFAAWAAAANVLRVGPVGSGNALRLVHNATLGVAIAALGEALRAAADMGLDRTLTLDALTFGPLAFTVQRARDELDSGDYSDVRLSLDRAAREMRLALDSATRDLPAVRAALASAEDAVAAGHGDENLPVLASFLEREGRPDSG